MRWKGTLAIIRHAERADFPKSNSLPSEIIQVPEDPPLTLLGLHQARITANTLWQKQILQDQHKVILLSSPFYRTLQTSAEIAKSIGLPQIFVDYGFMEILHRTEFQRDPISSLRIRNENLQNQLGVNYQELAYDKLPEYPEEYETSEKRLKKSLDDLIYALDNGLQGDLVMICTHMFGMNYLSQLLGGIKNTNQYCSVTVAKRDEQGQFKILIDQEDLHLEQEKKFKASLFKKFF